MEMNGREDQPYEESSEWFKYFKRQADWLEKTRGNLMVVATVIASMSFQAMVNPPGGVWQADGCPQNQTATCKLAGTSVLEGSKRILYLGMVISCTVSFSASMTLILLVISGLRLRNRVIMAILVMSMTVAVLCISAGFFFAVALVQSGDDIIIIITLLIYFAFWVVFLVVILLIQLVRLLVCLIRFICCCARRQRPTRRLPPLTPSTAP